ncbi:MAG: hypothetical protein ACOYMR_02935 [Ilumatobacteraceae bacterium]
MVTTGNARLGSRRVVTASAAGLAGLAALWWFVAWVFSSDRGLDLTDESLYLLALDPPSKEAGWVTPFGWSTSPLFDVVGHDIARTRTLAVVLLVVVGGLMGAAAARWVRTDRIGTTALVAVGALGAPLLTASFLRTPGYNWANLIGLMLGVAGIALAARAPETDGRGRAWARRPDLHFAAALLALGCVVAVPAKSTSGIALLVVATVVLWREVDRRRALHLLALTAGWGVALVTLCILTGRWPASFLSVLWASTSFPPLHENQTIGGALHDVLRTPKVAWQQLSKLPAATWALVAAAVVTAVVTRRRRDLPRFVRCLPLVLCAVAAVGAAVPWPVLGLPDPAFRFAWFGTTNAALLLLLGAVLHLVANGTDRRAATRAGLVTLMLGVLVVAFGFGSAMSVYNQAALAAVLILVAATVVTLATTDATAGRVGASLVAASTLCLVVSNVVDSRHHPYDFADIAQQTTPVVLGAHDDTLLVQPDTAEYLTAMRAAARGAGLCESNRVIGLRWGWSSAEPFALGATVPDSLILTIFGYPDAVTLLPVTMARMNDPAWHDAWVMTTDPATIEPQQQAELQQAFDRLPNTVGRTFPDDYTMAADVQGTQLWRPAGLNPAMCP